MKIIENAMMKDYTSFKVGGPADMLVLVESEEELNEAMNMPRAMMLGNGSNTLFSDAGYRGTVVKLGKEFMTIEQDGNSLIAGGAVLLPALARFAQSKGLAGLEFACGIPGSVGGATYMNAGAYEHSLSELFDDSEGYGYRKSPYMDNGKYVTKVRFNLNPDEKKAIEWRMREYTLKRTSKQPLAYPSAGSFFKRPEGYFAGKLIQDAGLKGYYVGGAQVSELHAGFIINTGNATASDILELMNHVQEKVMDQFGVKLEPEVRIIAE